MAIIKSAADLVTTHEATCAGFLAQAISKTKRAEPHIAHAVAFWNAIQAVSKPQELMSNPALRATLSRRLACR